MADPHVLLGIEKGEFHPQDLERQGELGVCGSVGLGEAR